MRMIASRGHIKKREREREDECLFFALYHTLHPFASIGLRARTVHTLCFRRRNVRFSGQITTLERGTFDGLGQLWSPLIADALNIIFVIVGMIGTRRFKAKAVVVVSFSMILGRGR